MDNVLPHWLEHLAVYYMALSMLASVAVSVLPTPPEILDALPDWRGHRIGYYTLVHRTLQRLSVVRQPWVRNGLKNGGKGA